MAPTVKQVTNKKNNDWNNNLRYSCCIVFLLLLQNNLLRYHLCVIANCENYFIFFILVTNGSSLRAVCCWLDVIFMYIIFLVIGVVITFILSVLSGGGASLLLMPVITAFIGVRGVAPIMTIGITFSSFSKVFYFWKFIDWKLFSWLFPSTIIGSVIGAMLLAEVPTNMLQVIIGIFLVSTVIQIKPRKRSVSLWPKIKAWHFAPMGLVVSFLSGLIGGVGPLMNSAYLNYGMSKEGLLGTRSANAILLHVTKIISYSFLGLVDMRILKYGLLVGVAASIGTYFGKQLLGHISESTFRQIVVVSMVVSGVFMLFKNKEYIISYWSTIQF